MRGNEIDVSLLFKPEHAYKVEISDWLDALFQLFSLQGLLYALQTIQEFSDRFGRIFRIAPALRKYTDLLANTWVEALKPVMTRLRNQVVGVYNQILPIIGEADARIWMDHLNILLRNAARTYNWGAPMRFVNESIEAWIDMMRGI